MKLSIVIVNYNVKHFLEQCLRSVSIAAEGIDTEVIVVDNASSDGSCDYLEPLFENVRFIRNKENKVRSEKDLIKEQINNIVKLGYEVYLSEGKNEVNLEQERELEALGIIPSDANKPKADLVEPGAIELFYVGYLKDSI